MVRMTLHGDTLWSWEAALNSRRKPGSASSWDTRGHSDLIASSVRCDALLEAVTIAATYAGYPAFQGRPPGKATCTAATGTPKRDVRHTVIGTGIPPFLNKSSNANTAAESGGKI